MKIIGKVKITKTNKMKKINIILTIMLSILWIPINTFAQARIEVTVQNATNGNNNGVLTIEVFGTFGNYDYRVLDKEGVTVDFEFNRPENFKIFSGMAPGEYEVIVNNGQNCVAGWSGLIKCVNSSNNRPCSIVSLPVEPAPGTGTDSKKAVYIGDPVGEPSSPGYFLDLARMTNMKEAQLNALSEKMENKISVETNKILTGGTSNFEIPAQEEINTDARFVYKFNEAGEMEWLVQQYPEKITAKERSSSNERQLPVSIENTKLAITAIFPNPFESLINISVNGVKEEKVQVQLLNLSGQLLLEKEYSLTKGVNNLQVETTKELPQGSYFLTILDQEGNRYTKTIIH